MNRCITQKDNNKLTHLEMRDNKLSDEDGKSIVEAVMVSGLVLMANIMACS